MNIFPRVAYTVLFTTLIASVVVVDSTWAQNTTLAGRWKVVYDGGSSTENFEIQIHNNQLFVIGFKEQLPGTPLPGDYREPFQVEDIRVSQQMIYFKIRRDQYTLLEYEVYFVQPDRLEGKYKYTNNFLNQEGAISGPAGVVTDAGKVTMTRIK